MYQLWSLCQFEGWEEEGAMCISNVSEPSKNNDVSSLMVHDI